MANAFVDDGGLGNDERGKEEEEEEEVEEEEEEEEVGVVIFAESRGNPLTRLTFDCAMRGSRRGLVTNTNERAS